MWVFCTDPNVQVYKVQQVAGAGHWGVAVVGDEVMLCMYYNTLLQQRA